MIKTYLVPTTEEVVELMKKGEVPSFLHCATCLDGLTNGEVMMKMFPKLRVTIMKDCVQVMGENYEFNITFSLDWWNAKWGE